MRQVEPSQEQQQQAANGDANTTTPTTTTTITAALRRLFLPEGYPSSVSSDYLYYQLWTIPVHITGWCGNALVTSSLLRAVGAAPTSPSSAAGAAALGAALKWLTKDGVGALGRLLVGSRLGREFDDDPRRWRMAAEALTSLGLALEVATALAPSQFLALASAGTFARAVGKGMGNPVFRVVQTHFAAEGDNVGAVAAKEEVWEVSAQMAGFACSVALLQTLQSVASAAEEAQLEQGGQGPAAGAVIVCAAWLVLQSTHVVLRWNALRKLRFRELSHKRAAMLAAEHVAAVAAGGGGGGSGGGLSGVDALSEREPMLLPAETAVRPRVTFGSSPAEVLVAESGAATVAAVGWLPAAEEEGGKGGNAAASAAEWARLYDGEDYLLAWRSGVSGGEGRVALKVAQGSQQKQQQEEDQEEEEEEQEGVGGGRARRKRARREEGEALVRALYQAAWLDRHWTASAAGPAPVSVLRESLRATRRDFPAFLRAARDAGWDVDTVTIKGGPRWRVVVAAVEEEGAER